MKSQHLLPPNSSPLEYALIEAALGILHGDEDLALVGRKYRAVPASFLRPLNYEYATEALSGLIADEGERLEVALQLHRERGTAVGLQNWLQRFGFKLRIETAAPASEPTPPDYQPYAHWAEYELHAQQALQPPQIERLKKLLPHAQPLRSRLRRLVAGYHRPSLRLNQDALGAALLSDNSGVNQLGLRLSFGQSLSFQQDLGIAGAFAPAAIHLRLGRHVPRHARVHWLLDDAAPLFEVNQAITDSGESRRSVSYQGQIWTAAPWTVAENWQNSRTFIWSIQSGNTHA